MTRAPNFKAGRIDGAALREVGDAAIRDVITLQREAGLRSVTDGEFCRSSWHMDFIYALDGVGKIRGRADPRPTRTASCA